MFGPDVLAGASYHLVFTQFSLPERTDELGSRETHPYRKPEEESSGIGFSMEMAVSSCEVRAVKYLAAAIGKEARQAPVLSSDIDVRGRLDISFISIGSPASNYKTRDAINNQGSQLLAFSNQGIVSKRSRRIILRPEAGDDYGLLMKCHPVQFPRRVWLICAGFGEWGSSGTAWYLAQKWREIHGYAKASPVAMILRVVPGQDESAEPVLKVRNSSEVEHLASVLEKHDA